MYGTKTQYADTDTEELVDAKSTMYVQKLCGTFPYYAISVEQTMLVALNTIATYHDHATKTTMGDIVWLFKYAATHPNIPIQYNARGIILHVTINASYICKEHIRSWSGGPFSLADQL